jgi:hypothetical protein
VSGWGGGAASQAACIFWPVGGEDTPENSDPNLSRTRPITGDYATSRKVAGSILDEVTELFNWPDPSGRTMALRSIQSLTEISTRNHPAAQGCAA